MTELLLLLLVTGSSFGWSGNQQASQAAESITTLSTSSSWVVTSGAQLYTDTHYAVLELDPNHSEELREMATALRTMSEQVTHWQTVAVAAQTSRDLSDEIASIRQSQLRVAAAGCVLLACFACVSALFLWGKHRELQLMAKVLAKHEARMRELLEGR